MERCPKCYTHPKLIQSGWSIKTLLCPVCRERFYSAAEVREKKKRVEKEKDVPSWWPLWRQGWYKK